jgi:2-polyprenyl-3-methyl-5-hydroxy-6-metoxy-1,4-benzoquinol methylase
MTNRIELPSDYPAPGKEVALMRPFVDFSGRRVLEIGCGAGRLTRDYARIASSVVAVDLDAAKVGAARRMAAAECLSNVSFRVGAAERLRSGGGPFDIALFSWSL